MNSLGSARQNRIARKPSAGFGATRGKPVEPFLVLVGAEIEGAHRHRPAAHPGRDLTVRLELLVLGGQSLTVEKQELAAKQSDAGRAVLQRLCQIARELDVGEQFDFQPVERGRTASS